MCLQVNSLSLHPRDCHSATEFYFSYGLTEVIMFGGGDENEEDVLSDTTVLRFGESMLRCMCAHNSPH